MNVVFFKSEAMANFKNINDLDSTEIVGSIIVIIAVLGYFVICIICATKL